MSLHIFIRPALLITTILILICPSKIYSQGLVMGVEEESALDTLNSIFGKDIDSEIFKKGEIGIVSAHDATMSIMDIQRNWDDWSPMFREIAGKYFLRKQVSQIDLSMSKVANLSARKVVNGGHLLPNWIETANFSIEWGNNLSSSDGGTDSSRILDCSKRLSGLQCTGIPDIVDSWADYFEAAWEKEIGTLGYIEPVGTASYLYDIYIANSGDNIIGNNDDQTPTLGFNYLGLTATYCDETINPICKSDISTTAYSYILVNNRIADTDTMKITSAHEFFHAIQFSYPTIDDWFSGTDRWWLEATATWIEEVAYDDVNDYYPTVRNWLKNPSLSLKYAGSRYPDHEYGDALFIIFMTDVYLKDRDFIRLVWENEDSGIGAINKVLLTDRYQSDFAFVFKEFVALNALANRSGDWGGYEEGAQYGGAAVTKTHSVYPIPIFGISGENAPQELGSNYIQFISPDHNNNRLIIEFDGSDSDNWFALVVKVKSDGTGFEKEEMALTPLLKYGCHSIDGFGTTYNEVFLVPAVLVDPGLSGTAPYYYKASMNDTCNDATNAYLVQANSSSQSNVSESKTNDRRCFIATAAFGSSESPYVIILRLFRDKYLLPYSLGQRFVRLYYTVSPSIADFIELHPPAPFLIRIALFPAVGIAFLCIKTTLMEKISLIIIALSLWLAHLLRHNQQN